MTDHAKADEYAQEIQEFIRKAHEILDRNEQDGAHDVIALLAEVYLKLSEILKLVGAEQPQTETDKQVAKVVMNALRSCNRLLATINNEIDKAAGK